MSRTPDQVRGRLLSTNSGSVDSLNVATRCDCKARHQHGIQRGAEGVAGRDCYTAAKGGIAAITRSMAVEFAPQRVRVNAIAPSATMTDRVRGRLEAGNPRVTRLAAAHLVGLIEPEDIANMGMFLASEESRMVTGHVYPVDSGVTIFVNAEPRRELGLHSVSCGFGVIAFAAA